MLCFLLFEKWPLAPGLRRPPWRPPGLERRRPGALGRGRAQSLSRAHGGEAAGVALSFFFFWSKEKTWGKNMKKSKVEKKHGKSWYPWFLVFVRFSLDFFGCCEVLIHLVFSVVFCCRFSPIEMMNLIYRSWDVGSQPPYWTVYFLFSRPWALSLGVELFFVNALAGCFTTGSFQHPGVPDPPEGNGRSLRSQKLIRSPPCPSERTDCYAGRWFVFLVETYEISKRGNVFLVLWFWFGLVGLFCLLIGLGLLSVCDLCFSLLLHLRCYVICLCGMVGSVGSKSFFESGDIQTSSVCVANLGIYDMSYCAYVFAVYTYIYIYLYLHILHIKNKKCDVSLWSCCQWQFYSHHSFPGKTMVFLLLFVPLVFLTKQKNKALGQRSNDEVSAWRKLLQSLGVLTDNDLEDGLAMLLLFYFIFFSRGGCED